MRFLYAGDGLQLAAKARHELDGGLLTQVFRNRPGQKALGPCQDVFQAASGEREHGVLGGHGMAERGHEVRQGCASEVLGIDQHAVAVEDEKGHGCMVLRKTMA